MDIRTVRRKDGVIEELNDLINYGKSEHPSGDEKSPIDALKSYLLENLLWISYMKMQSTSTYNSTIYTNPIMKKHRKINKK